MTAYAFETITSDQALNIQVGDYLTLAHGPASHAVVRYLRPPPTSRSASVTTASS